MSNNIVLAAKCAPNKEILSHIERAGLKAVEIYLSEVMLPDIDRIIELCNIFPFRYAVHAPTSGFDLQMLSDLVRAINADIVVFHNIYWDNEWEEIERVFKKISTKLCIENTFSVNEPVKFMRRYGFGRCLDLEHLQMECVGIFEEEFIRIINKASHIHLTGYIYGSDLWHTHIHHSPEHNFYMLDLLEKAGYSGMVVSEAKPSLQTYEEFCQLKNYYDLWKTKRKF